MIHSDFHIFIQAVITVLGIFAPFRFVEAVPAGIYNQRILKKISGLVSGCLVHGQTICLFRICILILLYAEVCQIVHNCAESCIA